MNLKTYNKLNFPLYDYTPCYLNSQYFINEIRGGDEKSYMFVNLDKKLLKKLIMAISNKKILKIIEPAIKAKKTDNEIISLLIPYKEKFYFKIKNKSIVNEIVKIFIDSFKKNNTTEPIILEKSPYKNMLTDLSTHWNENIKADLMIIWGNLEHNFLGPCMNITDYIKTLEYKEMYVLRNFIIHKILDINISYKFNINQPGSYFHITNNDENIYFRNFSERILQSAGISDIKKIDYED